MSTRNPVIHTVLSSVEALLLRERELFGETLIVDGTTSDSTPMAKRTHAVEQELFGPPPVPAPAQQYPDEPWVKARTLQDLYDMTHDCMKCPLGSTRTKYVFGTGDPHAGLMLIGEGPGADEDAQGEPFVGRAGQLLNKILEAINLRRGEVYICNIVKSRPPNNRKPATEEIEACIPYLWKQIELVKPRVILCLGLTAAQSLLKTTEGLGALRGQVRDYQGIPVMVTYHPAALLRNPAWKRPTWDDVQAVRRLYDRQVAAGT